MLTPAARSKRTFVGGALKSSKFLLFVEEINSYLRTPFVILALLRGRGASAPWVRPSVAFSKHVPDTSKPQHVTDSNRRHLER